MKECKPQWSARKTQAVRANVLLNTVPDERTVSQSGTVLSSVPPSPTGRKYVELGKTAWQ